MWPDAVIVSVEPDPKNFETLQRNVASLDGIHPIQAGLWGRKARIGLAGSHGEWGNVFKAKPWYSPGGMQAYSVSDLAKMYDIPAFDFVKIDIEGAEGQVYAPGSQFGWVDAAKAISLEVHDYFAGYFGLKDVSTRIAKVMKDRPFRIVSDNEHILYLKEEVAKTIGDRRR